MADGRRLQISQRCPPSRGLAPVNRRGVPTPIGIKHRHVKSYRPVKHKGWFTFEGLEACGAIIRRHLFGVGVSKEDLCVLRPEAIGEALGSLGAKLEARLSADHAQS